MTLNVLDTKAAAVRGIRPQSNGGGRINFGY